MMRRVHTAGLLGSIVLCLSMSSVVLADPYTGEPPKIEPPPPVDVPTPIPIPAPAPLPVAIPKPKPTPKPAVTASPKTTATSATLGASVAGFFSLHGKQQSWGEWLADPHMYLREHFGYTEPVVRLKHAFGPLAFSLDPGVLGANFLLALLFFILVGTSNLLFFNVMETHRDDIHRFIRSLPVVRPFHRLFGSWEKWNTAARIALLILLLLFFGLAGAYLNPSFSVFHVENIGMLFTTITAVIIGNYASDFCRYFVVRKRRYKSIYKPHFIGLMVSLVSVWICRTFELSPGYIFGLPISLFILSVASDKDMGILEFFGIFWILVGALMVWAMTPLFFSYEIIYDLGMLLYVIMIEAAFFLTLPLPYLPGGVVFQWRKPLWAFLFLLDVFLLLHTLFNPNSTLANLMKNPPARMTILIIGLFSALSALIWGLLLWRKRVAR